MYNLPWFALVFLSLFLQISNYSDVLAQADAVTVWQESNLSEVQELGEFVRKHSEAVFLVGNARDGYGTAFVISKKHRLLATNAHVADIGYKSNAEKFAIKNGTSEIAKVSNVWYHPGVRRVDNGILVRAQSPSKGSVASNSADLAIIELEKGVDLPVEFKFASPDELKDLFAQPVAMFGFPGHDTIAWPNLGEKAEATYRQGTISRITGYYGETKVPWDQQQFVQHSMANFFGFSGSPVFTPNGHVVIINNSLRTVTQNSVSANLSYGIRVDALWELIAYHGLDKKLKIPVSKQSLGLNRFNKPDQILETVGKANSLLSEGTLYCQNEDYQKAISKFDEVLKLMPDYAPAYRNRGRCYHILATDYRVKLSKEKRREYAKLSLEDSQKYTEKIPSDIWGVISFCTSLTTFSNQFGLTEPREKAASILSVVIDEESITKRQKAAALALRARARDYEPASIKDLDEATRIAPWYGEAWTYKSEYWKKNGRSDLAQVARKRALELWNAETIIYKADKLLSSSKRDDWVQAKQFALEACKASDYKNWFHLSQLGRALIHLKEFEEAQKILLKSLDLAYPQKKSYVRELIDIAKERQKAQ